MKFESLKARKCRGSSRSWRWSVCLSVPNKFGSLRVSENWEYSTRKEAIEAAKEFCRTVNITVP